MNKEQIEAVDKYLGKQFILPHMLSDIIYTIKAYTIKDGEVTFVIEWLLSDGNWCTVEATTKEIDGFIESGNWKIIGNLQTPISRLLSILAMD